MKLLIVTQKIDKNDPILGFFHRWIEEFANHWESIEVICLYKGTYSLPENVKVHSLGKEKGESRIKYIFNFYKNIFALRNKYDGVFVHMNPIYVIMGALFWKIFGKKIALWYTHKMVSVSLRMATLFSDIIFTASKESFRLNTKKVIVMGHGIDTEVFSPSTHRHTNDWYTILSVGRISSTKNQLLMIKAFALLKQKGFKGKLVFVGSPITILDESYNIEMIKYVEKNNLNNEIIFKGPSKPHNVIDEYQCADLFINLSSTGSLDKAVLEAMACGLQIVTSNEAFKEVVLERNYCNLSLSDIAEKISVLSNEKVDPALRQYVVEKNNINNLIPAISEIMKKR